MSERLQVRRLVLTAPGKNYEVVFRTGVNLVTGPISTGKSSILQLLDFGFGGRHPPTYPEISKCSDSLIEISVGAQALTIRRALRGSDSRALVYEGTIDDVFEQRVPSKDVSANHVPGAASISTELMTRLGLDRIEVKSAPTQDASATAAFSFRDLVTLLRVDQDRMGATRAFFEDKFPKAIKWKAGFEIVHGLYDQTATALSASLLDAERAAAGLRQQLENARTFLDQSKIPDVEQLQAALAELDKDEASLKEQLAQERTNQSKALAADDRRVLDRRRKQEQDLRKASARTSELSRTLDQLGRLRVQYERERSQLEFLKESERIIGALPVVRCPSCFQPLRGGPAGDHCHVCTQELAKRPDHVSVDARLRSAKRRISDLESYIKDLEQTKTHLESERSRLQKDLAETDLLLTRIEETTLLPSSRRTVERNEALARVESKRRQAKEHLQLRMKARGEGSNLLELQERVTKLQAELEKAKGTIPNPEAVIESLSTAFRDLMIAVKFPNLRDARIDRSSYHPIVRDQDYSALSSKGAIALAVSCWHLAVLKRSLREESRFPMFLLLDSPLSHVGRDSSDSEFRDQKIVDAFYDVLANLNHEHGAEFQIIVCDNRPAKAAGPMIAVEFTGDPKVGRYGLIDDETGSAQSEIERP